VVHLVGLFSLSEISGFDLVDGGYWSQIYVFWTVSCVGIFEILLLCLCEKLYELSLEYSSGLQYLQSNSPN